MSEKYILTFSNQSSYEDYKQKVTASGGTIEQDYGKIALGFSAIIPSSLVGLIQSSNFGGAGITSFEPDSKVTIQA